MRDVYANASCNIAASASSSPAGGLVRSRVAKDIRPGIVTSNLASQRCREFYMFDKGYWDRHLLDGALHSRGRVFQERFLSPRQIYFTKSQAMWKHLEEHRCEGLHQGVPLHESSKSIKRLSSSQTRDDELKIKGLMTLDALDLWIDIVTTYSQCQFTLIEDKLYAFGGIAKLFRQVTAEVIDANVTTNEGDDMVNITGSSIALREKVYSTTYKRKSSPAENGCIHFDPTDKTVPPFTTWPCLDSDKDSLDKSGETSLLPLRNQEVTWEDLESNQSGKANDVTCLILKKSGDPRNSYRRIGWLKF
ncbi:hypothetical protein CSAL01_06116 [Colletotrichum salicis]|uniref:Uncharacterized protein n=1 Tax=Colletotrichum salicis TaxID=1209931 RepID=A0A135U8Y7_9PEZI|nr:hypothetical protein CSAL01_06116 [Colletotrichum salicis]